MKQYEGLRHGTRDFPVGIHDTLCATGFSLYPHIHREFEILVMKRGEGVVYIEEEKFELCEGEGVFVNSEELHIGVKTNNTRAEFFAVVFAPEIFGGSFEKCVMPLLDGRVRMRRRLTEDMVRLVYEIHEVRDNELLVKSRLFELWDICLTAAERTKNVPARGSGEIKGVMEYIREHYSEEITIDMLAKEANMSVGYFCRRFNSLVHMTPFGYINEVRILKSCELLKNEGMSIGEVSMLCGFNSFSYFSKRFSEKMGMTPKKWRQEHVRRV